MAHDKEDEENEFYAKVARCEDVLINLMSGHSADDVKLISAWRAMHFACQMVEEHFRYPAPKVMPEADIAELRRLRVEGGLGAAIAEAADRYEAEHGPVSDEDELSVEELSDLYNKLPEDLRNALESVLDATPPKTH